MRESTIETFLNEISERAESLNEMIQIEEVDDFLQDKIMEINTLIQYIKRLSHHKLKNEIENEKIIQDAFYLILTKFSEDEKKMIYGFENLDIGYTEFLENIKTQNFSNLQIKVLLKSLFELEK